MLIQGIEVPDGEIIAAMARPALQHELLRLRTELSFAHSGQDYGEANTPGLKRSLNSAIKDIQKRLSEL